MLQSEVTHRPLGPLTAETPKAGSVTKSFTLIWGAPCILFLRSFGGYPFALYVFLNGIYFLDHPADADLPHLV